MFEYFYTTAPTPVYDENVRDSCSAQKRRVHAASGEPTYSYCAPHTPQDESAGMVDMNHAPLAGFGYGLPVSRLYARYLGGELNLISTQVGGWAGQGRELSLLIAARHCRATDLLSSAPLFHTVKGYGTDAFVYLRAVAKDAMEVVPSYSERELKCVDRGAVFVWGRAVPSYCC